MGHPWGLLTRSILLSCCAAPLTLIVACVPSVGPDASPALVPTETAPVAVATPGDPCVTSFACSADRMAFLRCDGEKMVEHALCRGPRHCQADERGVACDQSVADIGDACDGDGAACSVDGINLLVCRDGRRMLKSACTTGCEVQRKMGLVSCHGTDITP